jgi:tRNA(adenine34) deaminase
MCAGAIGWSQLSEVIYGTLDEKRGFMHFAPRALHPKTVVRYGVLEEECAWEIQEFFRKKRKNK